MITVHTKHLTHLFFFIYLGNQDFKVWGQRQKLPTMRFAVEIGADILSFYEDFFGTKFPLKKMDMAAIPDFGPGAMENWGLITYQVTYN